MTTATPTRLPVGNSGREYRVTESAGYDHRFPVIVEPMTGRRGLPSATERFAAANARALGLRLVELAVFAEIGESDPRPPRDVRAYGTRAYRAVLRIASEDRRRVRLVATGRDGDILPSLSDAFAPVDARALGLALIGAAAVAEERGAA